MSLGSKQIIKNFYLRKSHDMTFDHEINVLELFSHYKKVKNNEKKPQTPHHNTHTLFQQVTTK